MKPAFTIEFRARSGRFDFEEESVTLDSPDEVLAFVAPGGGCESVPDAVDEIHISLLHPLRDEADTSIDLLQATLQVGMVFVSGPLAQVTETLERLRAADRAGQLSQAFRTVIGASL